MANREQLLAEANEKGIEVPENATKAEIAAAIKAAGSTENVDVTPEPTEPEAPVESPEGEEPSVIDEAGDITPADVDKIEVPENTDVQTETTPTPAPVVPAPSDASTAGSEIAAAISQGLQASRDEKKIVISSDNSVTPRFNIVKNAQGEVLLRENETGVLSKVQLESLEEKEASIQGQEVEEV